MTRPIHAPVLLEETLVALAVRPGGLYLDGTCGSAGHGEAILRQATPGGRLVALDRDPAALQRGRSVLADTPGDRWLLVRSSFANMSDVLAGARGCFDGVLLDLGYSSDQLEDSSRGFSYSSDGPLDMRLSSDVGPSAAERIRDASVEELTRVIRNFGEERAARRVALAIEAARTSEAIETTAQLARVVGSVVPERFRTKTLARVFQAIRIWVNGELEAVEAALPAAVRLLAPGGRLVVIAFHSLEDRIVKRFMVEAARHCICPPEIPECRCDHVPTLRLVSRKPVRPGSSEVERNPRSRSARLRVAERLSGEWAA